MKKTCTLLVLVAVLLIFFPAAPAGAANDPYPVTLEEARQYVNQEIEGVFCWPDFYPVRKNINGTQLSLNEPVWGAHKALAYGTYFGNAAANGERRYIGYNPLGSEFPNPNYPPDDDATTSLNGWEWQEYPWLYEWAGSDLYTSLPNEADLRASLNQKIIEGIEYSYGSHFNENDNKEWWRYVLVVQPPTKYTYGYGRMWHRWDSNKDGTPELWYITMRLAPDVLPPDVEVVPPQPKAPVCLPCTEKASVSISDSWEELYEWQVYHPDSYTEIGKDGKPYEVDCSWWEYKSASPTYTETLKSVLSVNTKQGIPTDRENPCEADRESRGSWEIIPYAQANGLNPNEVTRAGYGFGVKVKTTYWSDWESKVPDGAAPHGGTYHGPSKVTAQFYDTSMRPVEEIELEATSGYPGGADITWELPLTRFSLSDGTETWVRKHYTDVQNKDGYYGVRILVEACGRGQLSICQDKYVMIYGDMYDDIYTRPATREEQ
jgi:hypothetical protein